MLQVFAVLGSSSTAALAQGAWLPVRELSLAQFWKYRVPLRFIWQALNWALYYLSPLLGFTIRS